MSTSFATTGAWPWSHRGTTHHAVSQLNNAKTTHSSGQLLTELVSTNWSGHVTIVHDSITTNAAYLLRTAQQRTLWSWSRVDVFFPTFLAYLHLR